MSSELSPLLATRLPVGWREWLAIPGLGIPAIKAKIDTGAKTSALHAHRLSAFSKDGAPWVRFTIRPLRRKPSVQIKCECEVLDRRVVTDSGGHKEQRYVIKVPIALAGHEWPVEMTLTNRDTMLFRMLLGREAMQDRLIVDPAASYLHGRELGRVYRNWTG